MGTGKCTKYPKVVSQYFYNYQPYTATISDLDAAAAAATAASTSDQQRTKANKARVPWAKVATPPSSVANDKDLGGCAAGSSNYWANTVGVGVQISQDHAGAASDCCAKAKTVPNAYAWTYENAWGKAGGSCIYWSTLYTGKSSVGSATGLVDQPTKLSDFHDLADYSCLYYFVLFFLVGGGETEEDTDGMGWRAAPHSVTFSKVTLLFYKNNPGFC